MVCQKRSVGRWFALMLVMVSSGLAQSVAAEGVRPLIIGGLAFGGDTLVDTTGEDLKAGGLIYLGFGVLVEPAESDLMYQVSVGYKFDTVEFTSPSGEASISTLPIDAIVFYKFEKSISFGAGVTRYLNPKSELCFDAGGCATVTFKDALGLLAEARFQLNEKVFMGVRLTDAEYEVERSGVGVDASNVQVHIGLAF